MIALLAQGKQSLVRSTSTLATRFAGAPRARTAFAISALILSASLSPARAATDEELVRSVADQVVGSAYRADASGQQQAVFNGFHGWYYQTKLIHDGLSSLGEVLGEKRYATFSEKRLDELAKLIAKTNTNPHTGFYFKPRELWMTGLAADWLARAEKDRVDAYQDYANRFAGFIQLQARVEDGVLANNGHQVRTDDAYLLFRPLLQLARINKDAQMRDTAITQVLGTHRKLFSTTDGLYRHAWDSRKNSYSDTYWGRGNSWMALAHVDLLAYLPPDDPRRPEALAAFRAQVAGLRRWQAEQGGWRQVMDAPESWVETSCTAMFVYAIARGVREGWLESSDLPLAVSGWNALRQKIEPRGSLIDICPGTGPGNREFYLNRPRERDNSHGAGPILLAGSEMLRRSKNGAQPHPVKTH